MAYLLNGEQNLRFAFEILRIEYNEEPVWAIYNIGFDKYNSMKSDFDELIVIKENTIIQSNLKEIILAMNADPEGENTADFLHKLLVPLIKKHNIKISLLGRGLSTGAELEYADADTLKNALRNRY